MTCHSDNISTTLYNTLQSTALQQFYSLQPLQHPSGSTSLKHALSHGPISSTTLYNTSTVYSSTHYSSSTVYNLYNAPLRDGCSSFHLSRCPLLLLQT